MELGMDNTIAEPVRIPPIEYNRDWALLSKIRYIRSQDELSVFNGRGTGRVLTAVEAYDAFGPEVFYEIDDRGSAILVCDREEPAKTIRERREQLGLTVEDLARAVELDVSSVRNCEDPREAAPIRDLEKISICLGLDERLIAFRPGAGGDDVLAHRLKTIGTEAHRLSGRAVAKLTEAACVVKTQIRLRELLGEPVATRSLPVPDAYYGDAQYPAWRHGYDLAARTRRFLGFTNDEPIPSLRELCRDMGIPLLQAELPRSIAGATICVGENRAIIVNVEGDNTNVWVRRATIAHELGHLLWDPAPTLKQIRVDRYEEFFPLVWGKDFVEARANAFAVEFLAPREAILRVFNQHADAATGLRNVMERFGLSVTAARFHLWNATDRGISLDELVVTNTQPTDEWRGMVGFADDYFPIHSTPDVRRGEFAGIVVAAEAASLISADTAAEYLAAKIEDYANSRELIAGLYPDLKTHSVTSPTAVN